MPLIVQSVSAVLVTAGVIETGAGFDSFEIPSVQKFFPLVVLPQ